MVDTRSETCLVRHASFWLLGVLWTAVSMCYVASSPFVFVYIQQQRWKFLTQFNAEIQLGTACSRVT